jgi:hypothetical protein
MNKENMTIQGKILYSLGVLNSRGCIRLLNPIGLLCFIRFVPEKSPVFSG